MKIQKILKRLLQLHPKSVDLSLYRIKRLLKDLGNPYDDLAKDELGKQSINFGIYGIPESILINKDLVIIKKFIGPISKNDYNYIKNIVRK